MAAQGGARSLAASQRREEAPNAWDRYRLAARGFAGGLHLTSQCRRHPAGISRRGPRRYLGLLYLRNLDDARRSVSDRRRSGDLTKSEARALKKQQRVLQALGDRYAADGLSESEERELAMLSQALLDLSRAPVQPPPR